METAIICKHCPDCKKEYEHQMNMKYYKQMYSTILDINSKIIDDDTSKNRKDIIRNIVKRGFNDLYREEF